MAHDVFISYSSRDRKTVERICAELEKRDIRCWMAPRDITGGASYAREIIGAINDAQVFLFVFSEHSNCSEHVENEIDNAFIAQKVIIPFRIGAADMNPELKYYLNKKHWIDATAGFEPGMEVLIRSVETNLPERQTQVMRENLLDVLATGDEEFIHRVRSTLQAMQQRSGAEQSVDYEIRENKEGELLLLIGFRKGRPENPRLYYDGGEHALLYRNPESSIVLYDIGSAADPLLQADEVLVCETENDGIGREYKASVRIVSHLDRLLGECGLLSGGDDPAC